ncbi:Rv2175c family DNA-binding protein [Melissospora conviva]|uniref:Rv2175c family DNA-binding protein n=1 Tax=Melissospora conviva TaxID=3388432 RepID=UPI003B81D71A
MTESVPADPSAGAVDAEEWLTLPDVAERLGVSISKVHQKIRDRELIAVRRDGVRRMPAELIANDNVHKHLPGVLNLLRDAGYDDDEAMEWLLRPDDSLPGTPARALAGDLAREVKRRAQALGY